MVARKPVGELVVAISLGTIPLTGYFEGMVTKKLLDSMQRSTGTGTRLTLRSLQYKGH